MIARGVKLYFLVNTLLDLPYTLGMEAGKDVGLALTAF